MHTFVTLSLALGASAWVVPRSNSSSCSFELTASGGQNGNIGQLSDGQNRIGGGLALVTFTIDNGGITDSAGSGCILTPEIEQFQCDQYASPTYGFSIASNGSLEYEGDSVFYACPASDTEWNLYTTPVAGQLKCVEISLTASACAAAAASSTCAPQSTVTVTAASEATCSPQSTVTVTSVSTVTAYDCSMASSASQMVSTAPASIETSVVVPVEQSSVAAQSTIPAQAASTPVEASSVYETSTAAVQTTATTPEVVSIAITPAIVSVSSVGVQSSVVQAETTATTPEAVSEASIVAQSSVQAETTATTSIAVQQTSVLVEASSTPVQVETTASSVAVQQTTVHVQSASTTPAQESATQAETTATVVPVGSSSVSVAQGTASTMEVQSTLTATIVPTSTISVSQEASSAFAHTYVSPGVSSSTAPTVVQSSATSPAQEATSPEAASIVSTTLVAITSTAPQATNTPMVTSSRYYGNSTMTTSMSTSAIVSSEITSTSTGTPTTSSASSCVSTALTGTYTAGNYQYPHLIVPISEDKPTIAAGTSYFGYVSSNESTIFNFDIPATYAGDTCYLIFLLPEKADLETSSYTLSGSGEVTFSQLSTYATEETTWDNAPSVSESLGTFDLTEGSSTLVQTFACSGGDTVAWEMSAGASDTYLEFFQDYNPSPLGLYVTYCAA
ncbi:hypothetical protein LSUE1_G007476 [Lachnellula suecica]|uniref:Ubiquitin 3 binding protein But2 C-terminal domain-containing protein n=1 Tax=Lachnellula suecica TaxID=602035 RepID=A0A8T9C5B6_9HELO|nr:hypothetical protein LSUE1_G007476 [Lachnellula suecica]